MIKPYWPACSFNTSCAVTGLPSKQSRPRELDGAWLPAADGKCHWQPAKPQTPPRASTRRWAWIAVHRVIVLSHALTRSAFFIDILRPYAAQGAASLLPNSPRIYPRLWRKAHQEFLLIRCSPDGNAPSRAAE